MRLGLFLRFLDVAERVLDRPPIAIEIDVLAVHRIAEAAPAAIIELERRGVVFDRDPAGRLTLGLEAAHARRRIVHVTGDGTGAAIMRALVAAVQATPSITVTVDMGMSSAIRSGSYGFC